MNEAKKNYLYIAGLLLVIFALCYLHGCGSSVRNDGSGIDGARTNIQQAGDSQREATAGIGRAEKAAGGIAGGIERIENTSTEERELIERGKQILATIRKRAAQ